MLAYIIGSFSWNRDSICELSDMKSLFPRKQRTGTAKKLVLISGLKLL